MRFDSGEHVERWRSTGRYPRIHDAVTALLQEAHAPRDGVVLDLCSSSGLLGCRLVEHGYRVVAAQEPTVALSLGRTHGVYDGIPVFDQRIAPDTLPAFYAFLAEHDVRAVVARRCLPELSEVVDVGQFGGGLLAAGVQAIVLEGRAVSTRTTHPLGTAAAEVAALRPTWQPAEQRGALALLLPTPW